MCSGKHSHMALHSSADGHCIRFVLGVGCSFWFFCFHGIIRAIGSREDTCAVQEQVHMDDGRIHDVCGDMLALLVAELAVETGG